MNYINCSVCDKKIINPKRNQKYCKKCSKEVRHQSNIKRAKEYRKRNPYKYKKRKCAICGKTIVGLRGSQKYCDECREEVKRQYRKEYKKKNKEEISKREAERYSNNKNRILKQHKEWLEQNPNYFYQHDDKRRYGGNREKVLKRDNCQCQICGSEKKLVVHHIDENNWLSDNPNNNIDNLITLCKSCHRKVHQGSIKI